MADLKKNNGCVCCEYYDSEANDFFHQWCHHPNIEDVDAKGDYVYQDYDESPYSDSSYFVSKCPLDGKSPYDEE